MKEKQSNEYDVEQWRHKRLKKNFSLNSKGASFALILLSFCEIAFVVFAVIFPGTLSFGRFLGTFSLILSGFLLQRFFVVQYDETKINSPISHGHFSGFFGFLAMLCKPLIFILKCLCGIYPDGFCSFEIIRCGDDDIFFKHRMHRVKSTSLKNYPIPRLLIESFVLFVMCVITGYAFSPYLALFLFHSSLAALVIDSRFSLWKFNAGFFFFLALLLGMHGSFYSTIQGYTGVIKWSFIVLYTIILFASCMLTSHIVQRLMREVDKNAEKKILEQVKRVDKILAVWRTSTHLAAIDKKSGNYILSLPECSDSAKVEVMASEVIMLIPTCLRQIGCKVLTDETFKSVNSDCKKCDVENCDIGFIVNELGDKVFWRIVGHGHNIKEAFQSFETETQRKPSVIFGIACVNSFSELVGKMIGAEKNQGDIDWHATVKEFGITRIFYAKLIDEYADCPSLLNIPVDEHSRIQTRINRESFIDFLKYTIKDQPTNTSSPNKKEECKSLF